MAQNEMKAKPALPERVRSMEGLGVGFAKVTIEYFLATAWPTTQALLDGAGRGSPFTPTDARTLPVRQPPLAIASSPRSDLSAENTSRKVIHIARPILVRDQVTPFRIQD